MRTRPTPCFCTAFAITIAMAFPALAIAADAKPNLLVIVADDLGYGDVGCYGAKCVATPNIDRLAVQGLKFTDAHATSATCTPSRYALLTGEYPWRKRGTGILPGDARLIIDPDRVTLPDLMKQAGYTTGVVGKWHLGLGDGNLNWNGEIKPGPLEIGFDYAFLIPATGDRVPTVYVENRRVVGLDPNDPIEVSYGKPIGDEPTGRDHPELLKQKLTHGHDATIVNGISRIGYMTGGKAARWVDEDMADVITGKAVEFIAKNNERPFFLYFATHDIHVPRAPHSRFAGTSDCGVRGDVIAEFDWSVGEVMKALDERGLAENTLLIVTSDNGPIVDDGYDDGAWETLGDHDPSGPLRGNKYSHYEAGTAVPFIARWPGRIKADTTSDVLICQIDLAASFAKLTGVEVPDDAAPDSENLLPALLGESNEGRRALVEQGRGLALRKGRYKYIPAAPARGRGGSKARPFDDAGPEAELYDLKADAGERKNLAEERPEVVEEMEATLKQLQNSSAKR
ncbi:MAG: sulfatase-like hydrolase/transferase [Planctomycetota bacterium]|nr:sulfatase-like hydrolase/transferase [Planctomycetaceae bacterium]MDQ3332427.1 sulfatase-like hydrolase/transferase [Planctomycetota bacterium]